MRMAADSLVTNQSQVDIKAEYGGMTGGRDP